MYLFSCFFAIYLLIYSNVFLNSFFVRRFFPPSLFELVFVLMYMYICFVCFSINKSYKMASTFSTLIILGIIKFYLYRCNHSFKKFVFKETVLITLKHKLSK